MQYDALKTIHTNLEDNGQDCVIGKEFELNYEFEDYKFKVNKYIDENKNNIAIHKLRKKHPSNRGRLCGIRENLRGNLAQKKITKRTLRIPLLVYLFEGSQS